MNSHVEVLILQMCTRSLQARGRRPSLDELVEGVAAVGLLWHPQSDTRTVAAATNQLAAVTGDRKWAAEVAARVRRRTLELDWRPWLGPDAPGGPHTAGERLVQFTLYGRWQSRSVIGAYLRRLIRLADEMDEVEATTLPSSPPPPPPPPPPPARAWWSLAQVLGCITAGERMRESRRRQRQRWWAGPAEDTGPVRRRGTVGAAIGAGQGAPPPGDYVPAVGAARAGGGGEGGSGAMSDGDGLTGPRWARSHAEGGDGRCATA